MAGSPQNGAETADAADTGMQLFDRRCFADILFVPDHAGGKECRCIGVEMALAMCVHGSMLFVFA